MQEAPLMLKNKTARRIKAIPGFVFPGGVRVIINFTVDFDAMISRKISSANSSPPYTGTEVPK